MHSSNFSIPSQLSSYHRRQESGVRSGLRPPFRLFSTIRATTSFESAYAQFVARLNNKEVEQLACQRPLLQNRRMQSFVLPCMTSERSKKFVRVILQLSFQFRSTEIRSNNRYGNALEKLLTTINTIVSALHLTSFEFLSPAKCRATKN